MRVNAHYPLLNPSQQLPERGVAAEVGSQDVGVNHEADHRLKLRPVTVSKWNSYRQVVLARIAIQQRVQCGGEDGEQAGPFLPAQVPQVFRQRRVEAELALVATMGHDGWSGPICG